MYVLTIQRGESAELLACSNDIGKLHARMKEEVLGFLAEVYGDDEEAFEWLMPVSDEMNFWSDEDEEYRTTFRIEEVEEI
jgi:hypothetical protein